MLAELGFAPEQVAEATLRTASDTSSRGAYQAEVYPGMVAGPGSAGRPPGTGWPPRPPRARTRPGRCSSTSGCTDRFEVIGAASMDASAITKERRARNERMRCARRPGAGGLLDDRGSQLRRRRFRRVRYPVHRGARGATGPSRSCWTPAPRTSPRHLRSSRPDPGAVTDPCPRSAGRRPMRPVSPVRRSVGSSS